MVVKWMYIIYNQDAFVKASLVTVVKMCSVGWDRYVDFGVTLIE